MSLPTDKQARKNIPLYRGLFCYFPDALCAVAELSRIGNEQHNPGEPLHWAKEKSTDEEDALLRHMMDKASGVPIDEDKVRHATKVAWRALAALQREIEGTPVRNFVCVRCNGIYTEDPQHPGWPAVHCCEPSYLPSGGASAPDLSMVRVETHIPSREDREAADAKESYVDIVRTAQRDAYEQRDKKVSER